MSKFINTEMETIKKMAQETIPAVTAQGCTESEYYAKRAEMNLHIIQFCVGGEYVKGKKEDKFKFSHEMPSMSQVAELAEVVNTFIAAVEIPFFDGQPVIEVDDDTSIPDIIPEQKVPKFKKKNNKEIREAVLGKSGIPLYKLPISGLDVFTIAAAGDEARKKQTLTITLVIAGVVVGLTVAGVVGYSIYKKKQDEKLRDEVEGEINGEIEAGDVDIELGDDVEVDGDVEIDDELV